MGVQLATCVISIWMAAAPSLLAPAPGTDPRATASPVLLSGVVRDQRSASPVKGALVISGSQRSATNATGMFVLTLTVTGHDAPFPIIIKALGYRRLLTSLPAGSEHGSGEKGPLVLNISPLTVKAAYLSLNGVSHKRIRTTVLDLIKHTELNSVVIEMKSDRGRLSYKSEVPLAHLAKVPLLFFRPSSLEPAVV